MSAMECRANCAQAESIITFFRFIYLSQLIWLVAKAMDGVEDVVNDGTPPSPTL